MAGSKEQFFWDDGKESNLVELWEQHKCLYDTTNEEYKDRNKKNQAYLDIASSLKTTVDEIKKRMQSLRTLLSRVSKPVKSGSACPNPTKKSKWVQERLQFLLPYIRSRPSVSNIEATCDSDNDKFPDEEFDDLSSTSPTLNEETKRPCNGDTPPILAKKSRTKKRDEEEMTILRNIAKSLDQKSEPQKQIDEEDESEVFGKYVAKCMKKFDEQTRIICKNMIQNAIFQCEIGRAGQPPHFGSNMSPNLANQFQPW